MSKSRRLKMFLSIPIVMLVVLIFGLRWTKETNHHLIYRSPRKCSTENTVNLPPYGIRRFPPQPPPMAVPRDIVDRLASFHGFPFVWFVNQFMHYLMRPSPALERYLREHEEKVGLTRANRPIVGERTPVFEEHSNGEWLTNYDSGGWNAVFQPLSSCRPSGDPGSREDWTLTSTENTANLPTVIYQTSRPPQLPMSVPGQGYSGQFMHYLMRPSPALERYLREHEEKVGLTRANRPIVGVHVRRTDKYVEAPLFHFTKYMKHVETWYDLYDLEHSGTKVKRRVFITTGDPEVIDEAKKGYPQYEVLSDPNIVSLTSTKTRYSRDSLFGVISDVNMLSKCDYLVCTLSSMMGRLVYALMHIMWMPLLVPRSTRQQRLGNTESHGNWQRFTFKVEDVLHIKDNEKNGSTLISIKKKINEYFHISLKNS